MNKKQKICLLVCIAVIVMMGLYPPVGKLGLLGVLVIAIEALVRFIARTVKQCWKKGSK